jgi:hypothetical protein
VSRTKVVDPNASCTFRFNTSFSVSSQMHECRESNKVRCKKAAAYRSSASVAKARGGAEIEVAFDAPIDFHEVALFATY